MQKQLMSTESLSALLRKSSIWAMGIKRGASRHHRVLMVALEAFIHGFD